MTARHWVHASPAFVGFDIATPESSGKKECLRAIEEAAAYVSLGHLRIAEEVAQLAVRDIVFTGGASKGRLWSRILADVLGLPVRVPVVKESTALGAAIYAGIGAGLYDDLAAVVADVVQMERTVEPDPAAHARYRELYEQWLELYGRSLELSETGIVQPLWRAAGT
jgi:autoinducer-2 kinase